MLTELHVKNFAIIDELRTSFGRGLNIISGETGAGKSIIIGAISLLLGDRATTEMIRSSADAAEVEALFEVNDNKNVKALLKDLALEEGDELIIKRIISRTGKNRIFINGHLSTLSTLSAVSESLVNVCGQHEHQVIMDEENHIDILDEFAGLFALRESYQESYQHFLALKAKLEQLKADNRRNIEKEDFIKFQLRELKEADLKSGEDAALEEEKRVLTHIQKLKDYAQSSYEALYDRSASILFELKNVVSAVREIKKIDNALKIEENEIDSVYYKLEDAAFVLRDYVKRLSYDPDRLEAIEQRLQIIRNLMRKYGSTIDDVLDKKTSLAEHLNAIAKMDEDMEMTEREIASQESMLLQKAALLSDKRIEAAARLNKAVAEEIHTLNMNRARFEVVFQERLTENRKALLGPKGYDKAAFYLSTNAGETLKSLNRIASGGELSRIMLAMKKVLAATGSVGTIIFDEVDAGIGGATAEIVGKKLKDVAANHQVICITHLPQIACFGDRHYRVWKESSDDATKTALEILSENERLDEMTRMLGGVEQTKKTREHAKEMLALARR